MGGVFNPPQLQDPNEAIWNALKVRGRNISEITPQDGEALVWSDAQSAYIPGTVAGTPGPAGPAGADGADGSDGITPTPIWQGTELGWDTTGDGLADVAPVNLQGPQGATGATGPAGPPGADGATGATGPAGPPGFVVLLGQHERTDYFSSSATIPADDTVPEITEGAEVLSVNVAAPGGADLLIQLQVQVGEPSDTGDYIAVCIFADNTCLEVIPSYAGDAGDRTQGFISAWVPYTPGTTNTVSYTCRIGNNFGAFGINGFFGARKYGGAVKAALRVWQR